ncbi:hypothetical protein GALL_505100 [mine drainage metagenome]|uniref:Uncharacterized protein n=1 Tax=mine drainage metagenome TaxID=410659 RepID=A0A1J5PRI9_9ZZZZ
MLDQPDHVIAKVAKQPRRDGGQVGGHINPAFGQQRAQGFQRMAVQPLKRRRIKARLPVDAAFGATAIPDQVGFHAHHGIAPAHLAARHRFQHEAVFARLGQLEHKRDRRVQIRRQPHIDDLIAARGPTGLERVESGDQRHGGTLYVSAAAS